jgi:hypothetical protein
MVAREVFQRIWNAMDRLAAAAEAGVYGLATMLLEGLAAYGLALHGYLPDSNLSCSGPSADDEKEGATHETAGNRDRM